jgi:hypothetical protein
MATYIPVRLGFTGTQQGMTDKQLHTFRAIFTQYGGPMVVFSHGDCVGADFEAATVAKEAGCYIVGYPGHGKVKDDVHDRVKRGYFKSDFTYPPKPYLKRNQDIVDASDTIIACPSTLGEILRSGTWATIRYARKQNKEIYIIRPDGLIAANS